MATRPEPFYNDDGVKMMCPFSDVSCGTWCPMAGSTPIEDVWFCTLGKHGASQRMRKEAGGVKED